jgi:hypothetical protein
MNGAAKTTPGFSQRITIAFGSDKHGRRIAYRLAGPCVGLTRKVRMSLSDAEKFVAMDLADLTNCPATLPRPRY